MVRLLGGTVQLTLTPLMVTSSSLPVMAGALSTSLKLMYPSLRLQAVTLPLSSGEVPPTGAGPTGGCVRVAGTLALGAGPPLPYFVCSLTLLRFFPKTGEIHLSLSTLGP